MYVKEDSMDGNFFIERSKEKLITSYDLKEDIEFGGMKANLLATYNERISKYVISKQNEYFALQNNELMFFKVYENGFSEENLCEIKEFMEREVDNLVRLSDEHMSTNIKFIVWTDSDVRPEVRRKVKKFKFYKSYNLGLNGWVNGGVLLLSKQGDSITPSRFAKREEKHLFTKDFFN